MLINILHQLSSRLVEAENQALKYSSLFFTVSPCKDLTFSGKVLVVGEPTLTSLNFITVECPSTALTDASLSVSFLLMKQKIRDLPEGML